MPIYEYFCPKCQCVTEELFPIKDFPQTIACSCSGEAHKIISKSTFRLEGGGWEKDGYVSKMDKFRANMKAVDSY